MAHEGLDQRIDALLGNLDHKNVTALAVAGKQIREWIVNTPFPLALDHEITAAYQQMQDDAGIHDVSIAVRSSATAEDLIESYANGTKIILPKKALKKDTRYQKDKKRK